MTEIAANQRLIQHAVAAWDDLSIDDDKLHRGDGQDLLRRMISDRAGSLWKDFALLVGQALSQPPHCLIVRGRDRASAPAMLAAVSLAVGEMVNPYRESVPDLPMQQEMRPLGATSPDRVWLWHTDSANWKQPNDFSALAGLQPAPSGGATQILSLASVRASGRFDKDQLAPLWETAVTWPIDKHLGDGTFTDRCIDGQRLRFRRELLERYSPPEHLKAVNAFADLVDSCEPDVKALLAPGDVVVFDNLRTMHRAGPVIDPKRVRLLLRAKIRRLTW